MNDYTLYEYTSNGKKVVSAIHWRDGAKFRAEYPDAIAIGQFRVRARCYSVSNQEKENQVNELEIEIDINETEDVNINALTPKQKALRLNALVKLAQGSVFTNHDFEEALTLTRQLMKRQGDYD